MTTICSVPGCPLDAIHHGHCILHRPGRSGRPRGSTRAWRKLRQRVLRRAHHQCQHAGCHRPATHVHHKNPVGIGGPELPPIHLLQALCTTHHQAQHPHGR